MYENTYSMEQTSSFTLGKVFGWMFMALMITMGVAGLLYLGLYYGGISPDAYVGLLIVSSVLLIVESVVIQWRIIRSGKSLLVPFIIYAVTMGVLLSVIMLAYDMEVILVSFGMTTAIFGALALYGWKTKRSMMSVGYIAMSMLIGVLLISIINFFFFNEVLYWIVSLVAFGAIMLFTAFDVWRIKKIVDSGTGTRNLALYCAFHLYVDFIYMFLRIVQIVGLSRR